MKLVLYLKKQNAGKTTHFLTIKKNNLKRIVEISCRSKNKAVLAVTCTLMYKKITDPNQDIGLHQANLPDGFSGRGLDTKIVIPLFTK